MKKICRIAISIALLAIISVSFAAEVVTLDKSTHSWNGAPLPPMNIARPEVTILKIRIAPGERLPCHQHPVINAGYLLSGELIVVTDHGKRLHMHPGDTLIELVHQSHYGFNPSPEQFAEIVVFYFGKDHGAVTTITPGACGGGIVNSVFEYLLPC